MAAVEYARHLEQQLAGLRSARKVERTRLRLEVATADLLAEMSYGRLTVDEITERAGLAHGTFYRYYAGKHEIVLAVLQGFLGAIRGMRPSLARVADPYAAIHAANRHYVEVYRLNVGLMRCFLTLRSDDPLVAELGSRADGGLAARVMRSIARYGAPAAALPARRQELLIHAVIGAVDALLRKVYGASEPPLRRFADDPDAIATVLSDMWYRALYAPDPAGAVSAAASAGSAAAGRKRRASPPA